MCLVQERMLMLLGKKEDREGAGRGSGGPRRPCEDGVTVASSHRETMNEFEQESVGFVHFISPLSLLFWGVGWDQL